MKTLKSMLVGLMIVCCLGLWACSSGGAGNTNGGNTSTVPATANTSANSNANAGNPTASMEKAPYPQAVADEFIKSCKEAGSDGKLCTCLFDKIQDKYSLEEFTVMELKLGAGDPPDEFVQFVGSAKAQCMR